MPRAVIKIRSGGSSARVEPTEMRRRGQLKDPLKEETGLNNRFALRGCQAQLLFTASAAQLAGLIAPKLARNS